jgi:hypothetical protein
MMPARSQQGLATLAIVAVLGLIATASMLAWSAAALAEQRSAAQESRALERRTAAEAGLAWALARLNESGAHDAQCRATVPVAGASSLRQRAGLVSAASLPMAVRPLAACIADASAAGGWRCTCPSAAAEVVDEAVDPAFLAQARGPSADRRAAFVVVVQAEVAPQGQSNRLVSHGCFDEQAACIPQTWGQLQASEPTAATTVVSTGLALRPVLLRRPAAAVSAVGAVHAGAGVLLANRDPASGGRVLWSGSQLDVAAALITGPASTPPSDARLSHDATLAAQDFDSLGRALLGSLASDWAASPGVHRIDCRASSSGCAERVQAAIDAGAHAVHVHGDLTWQPLPGPAGSPPAAALVVDGHLQLAGPGRFTGVVLARQLTIDGRAGSLHWSGAALSAGRVDVAGSVQVHRSAEAVDHLVQEALAVLPAVESWREH